jgi:hypothetical protein
MMNTIDYMTLSCLYLCPFLAVQHRHRCVNSFLTTQGSCPLGSSLWFFQPTIQQTRSCSTLFTQYQSSLPASVIHLPAMGQPPLWLHQQGHWQPDTNNSRVSSRCLLSTQWRQPMQSQPPAEDRRHVLCGSGTPDLGGVRKPRHRYRAHPILQHGPNPALFFAALHLRPTTTSLSLGDCCA